MNQTGIEQFISSILYDLYQWGKTKLHEWRKPGMYEVLNYESTLEILDKDGEEAIFTKKEEVKFLQNNVFAFQDQAWGDGRILLDYQCSPGIPVDFYRSGHKTYILISLRDVKQKSDIVTFYIQWKIRNGFLKDNGFWASDINHCTKRIKINIIFPQERPPRILSITESSHLKTRELSRESFIKLPDKRWQVIWEKRNPKIYEHYILKWEW